VYLLLQLPIFDRLVQFCQILSNIVISKYPFPILLNLKSDTIMLRLLFDSNYSDTNEIRCTVMEIRLGAITKSNPRNSSIHLCLLHKHGSLHQLPNTISIRQQLMYHNIIMLPLWHKLRISNNTIINVQILISRLPFRIRH
jgi:hypothetical protein